MADIAKIRTAYKLAFGDRDDAVAKQIEAAADGLRDSSIQEAIRWYAARMPRLKVDLIAAQSSPYFAVPTDWLENSSRIVFVEFPIDQDPPLFLSPKDHRIIKRETGDFIYFHSNPDGQFRLGFTTRYTDAAPVSIPVQHEEIVAKFAAAVAAVAAADFYAHTIVNNVDAVNYRTKEQEWRDLGKNLREQVDRELRRDEMALRRATDSGTYFKGWAH